MELPPVRTRRLIVLGMGGLAAAFFAVAIVIYLGNPDGSDLPVAIQAVEPEPQSNVLSQSDIVVDLAVGYTAQLEVNGVEIPEDQLFRVEALNQLTFEPGTGKIIERLLPDRNCVRVRYRLIAGGGDDEQTFTWCFDAS